VEAWLDLTDARGKDERQRSKVFESGGASQQTEEKKVPRLVYIFARCCKTLDRALRAGRSSLAREWLRPTKDKRSVNRTHATGLSPARFVLLSVLRGKESNVQVLKQKNASCSVCQERLDCFYDDEEG